MLLLFCIALSFLLGLYISLNDIFSSSPMFFAFAKKSPALWLLGAIYGGLSVGFFYLLKETLIDISIEGGAIVKPISDNVKIWAFAAFAGISIKSLLGISFFNFRYDGGKIFPLGLATFVKIFEPQILKSLETDHYIAFDTFLTNAEQKTSHLSLQDIHNIMRNKVSARFPTAEVNSFLLDLANTQNSRDALSLYLRGFGKRIFYHTFPACKK
jgi:hypothetical protein